jgi:hypothetical protein
MNSVLLYRQKVHMEFGKLTFFKTSLVMWQWSFVIWLRFVPKHKPTNVFGPYFRTRLKTGASVRSHAHTRETNWPIGQIGVSTWICAQTLVFFVAYN